MNQPMYNTIVLSTTNKVDSFHQCQLNLVQLQERLEKWRGVKSVEMGYGIFQNQGESNLVIELESNEMVQRHAIDRALTTIAFAEFHQDCILCIENGHAWLHGLDKDTWDYYQNYIGAIDEVEKYEGGDATLVGGKWYVTEN